MGVEGCMLLGYGGVSWGFLKNCGWGGGGGSVTSKSLVGTRSAGLEA